MRSWIRVIGLILIGMAAGAGLGLYLGWVAWPTEFDEANPAVLEESYRDEYILMTATVYAADGDLNNARSRIASLGQQGQDALFNLTLNKILQGENETEIRQLVHLAADLGLNSPAMSPYLDMEDG